jgi:thiol-disulfide isomerase/thioredoxin
MPSRRGITRHQVMLGLAASLLSAATAREARTRIVDVPSFSSGRYQLTILQPRQAIPSLILFPLNGKPLNLASMRGRPVLLNFWATWCAACRMEMPILDRLQQREASSGLEVIAVSEDRSGRRVVQRFADRLKLRHLKIYLDPSQLRRVSRRRQSLTCALWALRYADHLRDRRLRLDCRICAGAGELDVSGSEDSDQISSGVVAAARAKLDLSLLLADSIERVENSTSL